jgi:hypothetical protein
MSTFHQEIADRLGRHAKDRHVVVFYDPRREFEPFVDEFDERAAETDGLRLGEQRAWSIRFTGSYLELRHRVETRMAASGADVGLVYVPGEERHRKQSPLMEFDLAGQTYEPQLRKLARDILRQRFSDGQIDELLEATGVGYREIASFFDGGSDKPSLLRTLFGGMDSESILSRWILEPERDEEIDEKGARTELLSLVHTRIGLDLRSMLELPRIRRELVRFVLVNEFRLDLAGTSPESLDLVKQPASKEQRERVRTVASELRRIDPEQYATLADEVEADLGLARIALEPGSLGAVDTFRFEEQRLLDEAGRLLAAGDYEATLGLARGRGDSHWVRTDPRRLAQWSVCEQAATLGKRVTACVGEVERFKGKTPHGWIERYTAADGWGEVDGLDRRLGAFLSGMDEEPAAAQGVSKARNAYREWVRVMTEGFVAALQQAQWDTGWDLHQTEVFDEKVRPDQGTVALFVVDAFRFEMARELADRLDRTAQIELQPAVAALPTVTPVGMAALLPGASTSFSVGESSSGVAGAIDGTVLPNWSARWKHFQAKVPGVVEVRLETLLQMKPDALETKAQGAPLILVRSQDIDAVGEAGVGLVAQQAMATVIPNLARAVHRLSKAGIHRFVVAADHGHLLDAAQDDDMKIEPPGGDTVDLHRRCWAGRGGKTPAGAVRVSGPNLGYDTDLDFVFPTGRGVFLSGGDLQYHHGGLSLQELLVPVLTISTAPPTEGGGSEAKVRLYDVPEKITNRTIGIRVELARDLFAEPHSVRVVLLHEGEQVGEAGMVQGAELDRRTKRIELKPGQPATVGLMLSRDDCKTVRLVVLDAETDAIMAQSKNLKVSLSI